jgi:hypothetical protein
VAGGRAPRRGVSPALARHANLLRQGKERVSTYGTWMANSQHFCAWLGYHRKPLCCQRPSPLLTNPPPLADISPTQFSRTPFTFINLYLPLA